MSMREVFGDQFDKDNFGKTLSGALVLVGPQKEAGALAIKCHDHLTETLERFVNYYCDAVHSGDWGNWNPEEDQVVIEARAALKMTKGALNHG